MIAQRLVEIADEEGRENALRIGEQLQASLETLLEIGDQHERDHAGELLKQVQIGIVAVAMGTTRKTTSPNELPPED